MFCKNCGKHITDSAKFCPFCGAGTVATVGFSPPAPRESEQTMTRVTGGMKYMAFSIMWRVLVLIEGFVLIPCAVKFFQALSGSKWALALLSASDSGAEIAAFLSAPPFIALAAVLIVFLGMISSGFGGEMLGLAIMWITAWVCGEYVTDMLSEATGSSILVPSLYMYGNIYSDTKMFLWFSLFLVVTVLILQFFAALHKPNIGRTGLANNIARFITGNGIAPSADRQAVPAGRYDISAVSSDERRSKSNSALLERLKKVSSENCGNEWTCSYCSMKNPVSEICCKDCGKYR